MKWKRLFFAILLAAVIAATAAPAIAEQSCVCVNNNLGRDLNLTVVWDKCTEKVLTLKQGQSMRFWCPTYSTAKLKLKWTNYKEEYYRFDNSAPQGSGCWYGNSLTVNPTQYGYKWNVTKGMKSYQ